MQQKIKACFVFNGKYDDSILDVPAVSNTRDYAVETLFETDYLNLSKSNHKVLIDVDDKTIKKAIHESLLDFNKDNDIFIFYFCGHGFISPDYEDLILGVKDIDKDNVALVGLSVKTIRKIIKDEKVKYYGIIIDSCHAEKGSNNALGVDAQLVHLDMRDIESKGMFFIPSTKATERATAIDINGTLQIPFTYYFFETLREGVENQNRFISFEEIHDSIKEKMEDGLPVITQQGSLFNRRIIKNIKYRDFVSTDIKSEEEENDSRLKVLLVKTAIKYPVKHDDFGVPMGLWVLKAFIDLYNAPIDIEIFDERLEIRKALKTGSSRKAALKIVNNLFKSLVNKSDVIGVSMCTCEVLPGLEKLQQAKAMKKVTFVGGIFTSSNEKYLLESNVIDYVVPGVGALPLKILLEWLAAKKQVVKKYDKSAEIIDEATNDNIEGVATRNNLNDFFVPTTDHLPNMTNDIWMEIIEKYKPFLLNENDNLLHIDVYSMRGCACACKFCSVQMECGRVPIPRTRSKVVSDIKFLYSKGFRYFSLKDEDALATGYNTNNGFKSFLEQVARPDVKFKIRTRIDRLIDRQEILNELYNYGVDEIQYGIESSSFIILKNIEKGLTINNVENVKNFIKKHADIGITANCSFILGLEGEDIEYYEQLFDFIKELYDYSKEKKCIKPYINFITPHPRDSEFPIGTQWEMITTDLNYFTHKFPVCVVKGSNVLLREKMLEIYERIISYTDSKLYNPSLRDNRYKYLNAVKIANKNVIDNPQLPHIGEYR